MSPIIEFENAGFFYIEPDAPADTTQLGPEHINLLFRGLNLSIPAGITSLIGENGVGKSTLMLLAAARLFPLAGKITLNGQDTQAYRGYNDKPDTAARLSHNAGFVYQNMEFDDKRPLAELLETAAEFGAQPASAAADFDNVVRQLDLSEHLSRQATGLPKGVLQRSVLALALLSAPKVLFLDEPVFALEEDKKEAALDFVGSYSRDRGRSVLFSAHQIHLCRDYAENTLLLLGRKAAEDAAATDSDANPATQPYLLGPSTEICTREVLEKAYRVPWETLHQKENLYREMLVKKFGDPK